MHLFARVRDDILTVINQLIDDGFLPEGLQLMAITAEPPRDSTHGDVATNVAMVVAKPSGKNPREVAQAVVDRLQQYDYIASADIAGPGFINLRLADSMWSQLILQVLELEGSYGNSELGEGRDVNLEYVSANPTGPLHIGHARGAVVGDVLGMILLKAGYNVTKEYYINDAGSQVDTLAQSAYLRYLEALGRDIGEIPAGLYPGEYLKPVGQGLAEQYGDEYVDVAEDVWLPIIRSFALDSMLMVIRDDLAQMGIVHDVFTSEKSLVDGGAVENSIARLEEKGMVYQGVLEPPKGKVLDDWEPREQTLFRTEKFGDDVDRPLKKSDGSSTYFASDIAYHQNKLDRGFNEMVLILGADHGGYVKRMKAAVSAMSNGDAVIDILLYQLVNFMENGVPMKMSKRAGTFTTVRDVVDMVGKDVVRFIMLTRKSDAVLDFDIEKVKEQSRDNPVFYVQYAHARICSVLRNAASELPDAIPSEWNNVDASILEKLSAAPERDMVMRIAQWPRVVEAAATAREPHRVAFYLQELAASFHTLWNAGKDDPSLRFLFENDKDLTTARLAMIKACALTLASGLQVMGVTPVQEM